MALTQVPIELSSTPGIVDNSNATAITIDSSGNVGIGTSPSTKLHVLGGRSTFYSGDNYAVGVGNASGVLGGYMGSPAVNVLSFSEPGGVERMRIDASGNLLVGKTSADVGATAGIELYAQANKLAVTRASGVTASFNLLTDDGTIVDFKKDGSPVGRIGTNGGFIYIEPQSSGNGLTFLNTSVSPCTSNGGISDNFLDLGTSSRRFDDIFATNGTIQTSDRNEKQDIEALSDAEQRVAVAAKGLLRKFRWIDAVEAKGDDARIHFGIIAQDLQDAFTAEGLDAGRYAMFINSTWTDEETGEERSRMGVRYSELLAFIISAI